MAYELIHYKAIIHHVTHVNTITIHTIVWTPVILAIINIIQATLKIFMMMMIIMMIVIIIIIKIVQSFIVIG